MATQFKRIETAHREFIQRQCVFFTGSAAAEGRINVSPKGLDTLRVLDATKVVYLDLTGSGNETAAHLRANGRLTLLFCAFEGPPMILRLYGQGRILSRGSSEYAGVLAAEFAGKEPPGARQMVMLEVDLVQTSCGYGVPRMGFVAERPALTQWAEKKGEANLETYRREKNLRSIDGLPTGLISDGPEGVRLTPWEASGRGRTRD
jgi:predicted pyridoxine 5'-phosphate oxidase superfamily flavin-nucleotide-binding protein